MSSPAEKGYEIRRLFQSIAELSARVAELEAPRSASFELARVTVAPGGAQCTVQYPDYAAGEVPSSGTLTGPTRVVGFNGNWTPGVGWNVLIINSPAWSGIVCPLSAF